MVNYRGAHIKRYTYFVICRYFSLISSFSFYVCYFVHLEPYVFAWSCIIARQEMREKNEVKKKGEGEMKQRQKHQ